MSVDITKYPLLSADINITALHLAITNEEELLNKKQKKLDGLILNIQLACSHVAYTEERGGLPWSLNKKILLSKTCKACGNVQKKPEPGPDKVCENCWGPMKFEGVGHDEDRTKYYECTVCKHEYSHT